MAGQGPKMGEIMIFTATPRVAADTGDGRNHKDVLALP